jgi:phosphoribosylaminoimidazolecarboxamide formyltransferase / IMP cyclohydrolase
LEDKLKKIERALLSVSDKTGIVELARGLAKFDIELVSTGGTAKIVREAGLKVQDVSDLTGFPEILDGRVKTLHPKVHGGLLAVRDNPIHQAALEKHQINYIDLAIINLYPFRKTISLPDTTIEEAIENIDIGGPAMIRSAAKNFNDVAVVVYPSDYDMILKELSEQNGVLSLETRRKLAARAFSHTARYDLAVAGYFSALTNSIAPELGSLSENSLPDELVLVLERSGWLRYGENPHQAASLYRDLLRPEQGIANAPQLQGKELSYNNLIDSDAAWSLICEFSDTACAIIKHTNPCGVAIGQTTKEAFLKALETDPLSAFGGIVAFNSIVDEDTARALSDIFLEVVIAPDFNQTATQILSSKKNLRLITNRKNKNKIGEEQLEIRKISGGYLAQSKDREQVKGEDVKVVTERSPTEAEMRALDFAWKICKHVKSNAIVYARDEQLVGVGAGQTSRVDSVRFGAIKAQLPLKGTVLASDAFFPFRDGLDEAARHGITAVIQPGGSIKDQEVIAAANEHGIAMVFTGIRHFKH